MSKPAEQHLLVGGRAHLTCRRRLPRRPSCSMEGPVGSPQMPVTAIHAARHNWKESQPLWSGWAGTMGTPHATLLPQATTLQLGLLRKPGSHGQLKSPAPPSAQLHLTR